VVLLAKCAHEGTRDGACAVGANRYALLLQEVHFAVRETFVVAKTRADGLGARLAGKTGALLVEEAAERGDGLAFDQLVARPAELRRGRTRLAHRLTIAYYILSIIERLTTTRALEAVGMPLVTHRIC